MPPPPPTSSLRSSTLPLRCSWYCPWDLAVRGGPRSFAARGIVCGIFAVRGNWVSSNISWETRIYLAAVPPPPPASLTTPIHIKPTYPSYQMLLLFFGPIFLASTSLSGSSPPTRVYPLTTPIHIKPTHPSYQTLLLFFYPIFLWRHAWPFYQKHHSSSPWSLLQAASQNQSWREITKMNQLLQRFFKLWKAT